MNQNAQTPPWANPTPAGLVALSVACFCFFAYLSGRVTAAALPLMGCWLLGGFVIQLVVALLDLKSNNAVGGNTFLFFSAFFMLVGGMEMLIKFRASLDNIQLDARIDGWAWGALTLVLLLWTPAFFKSPLPLTAIVLLLDVALPFITLADLGILDKAVLVVPAWALLSAGIVAIYFCGAMVVNAAYDKTILPIPGPPVR